MKASIESISTIELYSATGKIPRKKGPDSCRVATLQRLPSSLLHAVPCIRRSHTAELDTSFPTNDVQRRESRQNSIKIARHLPPPFVGGGREGEKDEASVFGDRKKKRREKEEEKNEGNKREEEESLGRENVNIVQSN